MARGEPRGGAFMLGGDTPWQVPRVAGDTLHRGGGGGAMLRVDRLYTQATPRREAGATPLASPTEESLDGAEHGEVQKHLHHIGQRMLWIISNLTIHVSKIN